MWGFHIVHKKKLERVVPFWSQIRLPSLALQCTYHFSKKTDGMLITVGPLKDRTFHVNIVHITVCFKSLLISKLEESL